MGSHNKTSLTRHSERNRRVQRLLDWLGKTNDEIAGHLLTKKGAAVDAAQVTRLRHKAFGRYETQIVLGLRAKGFRNPQSEALRDLVREADSPSSLTARQWDCLYRECRPAGKPTRERPPVVFEIELLPGFPVMTDELKAELRVIDYAGELADCCPDDREAARAKRSRFRVGDQ